MKRVVKPALKTIYWKPPEQGTIGTPGDVAFVLDDVAESLAVSSGGLSSEISFKSCFASSPLSDSAAARQYR